MYSIFSPTRLIGIPDWFMHFYITHNLSNGSIRWNNVGWALPLIHFRNFFPFSNTDQSLHDWLFFSLTRFKMLFLKMPNLSFTPFFKSQLFSSNPLHTVIMVSEVYFPVFFFTYMIVPSIKLPFQSDLLYCHMPFIALYNFYLCFHLNLGFNELSYILYSSTHYFPQPLKSYLFSHNHWFHQYLLSHP